jgi:adenosylmethionine-8-amino-7-oxononanoate aminotransferase
MRGIEFVRGKATKQPFPRALGVAERIGSAAFDRGLIVYPGFGNANGIDGDQILIGPPLIISEGEVDALVEMLTSAIDAVEAELERAGQIE